jgi:predicted DNA-binding WGR domain protein
MRWRFADNLLTVALEAHHAERNHHRRYEATVGRDLFGDWTVTIRYGRVGQGGQMLRYAATEPEPVRAILRDRLRRRLSAPKRIGCAYRLASLSTAPEFDATWWLSGEVVAGFLKAG